MSKTVIVGLRAARECIRALVAHRRAAVAIIEKWSPLASEALQALADVTAEAPVPSDPSAVAARITDEVSRELGAALER